MAFNPDQYLKEKLGSKEFDPNLYLSQKLGNRLPASPEASKADISELESALRGAAEGATFGAAPAISGALEAIPEALSGNDVLDAYRKHRDASRAAFEAAQQANPKSYFAGSLAGGLLPAALTGGASEAATGAEALENAALMGAKYGAASGVGQSLSKGDSLDDTAENVIRQGTGGAILGGAVGKLSSLLSGAPEALETIAAQRAVKATGANKSQMQNLLTSPTASEDAESRLIEHGKNLLAPNEYTSTPIVTPLANPQDILERSQELEQNSGKAIGDILATLDNKLTEENSEELADKFFNPQSAIDKISELQQKYIKNGEILPSFKPQYNELEDVKNTVSSFGNNPIDFKEANELKQLITNLAYDDRGKLTNDLMGQVRAIVNDEIEKSADSVVQSTGDEGVYQKYLKAKDLYRTAKDAQKAALGKTAANLVNRDLGITDYISAGAGASIHGGPGAVAAALVNKGFRSYGNSLAATTSNVAYKVSNALSDTSQKLSSIPKEALSSFGEQLKMSGSEAESKLGEILSKASQRDDIGKNALIFSVMQNPTYRNILRKLTGQEPSDQNK